MPTPKHTVSKKLLEQARKNSIEAQIRERASRDHLHPNSARFLKQIIADIDYMRSHDKSELEIMHHLKKTRSKHEVLREILENRQEKWTG